MAIHHLDFDSIHEDLFLLVNFAFAGRPIAQNCDLSDANLSGINGGFYFDWLRAQLSVRLIAVAVKTRIILDVARNLERNFKHEGDDFSLDVRKLDEIICKQACIGSYADSDETLSLREACNKIVHALDVEPAIEVEKRDEHAFDQRNEEKRDWQYWSGNVELRGERDGRRWVVTLHVAQFAEGLEELVSDLESAVDWNDLS